MISKQSKGAWNSSNVFAFLLHHYVGPHLKDPTAAARVIVYKSCGELSLLKIVGFCLLRQGLRFPLFFPPNCKTFRKCFLQDSFHKPILHVVKCATSIHNLAQSCKFKKLKVYETKPNIYIIIVASFMNLN